MLAAGPRCSLASIGLLSKEDRSGLANTNSYASAIDGDAYQDGHCYASLWTGATTANKDKD